ncbi:hypothetical protein ACFWPK_07340 [Nocardia sp. NPDC058519]|uniref:hypothetical protein n=1 Tax=Nocardia sp. NPDC058519 TaxID=3346535 RepID=UPI00365DAAD6
MAADGIDEVIGNLSVSASTVTRVLVLCSMFVAPLVCWSLVAETVRGRIVGIMVLAAIGVAQVALGAGRLGHDFQLTGIAVLAVLVMVVLMTAPIIEAGTTDDVAPQGITKARIAVGWFLSGGYCVLSGGLLAVGTLLVLAMGRWAWVPPVDAIGSLPESLVLSETIDAGCAARSSNSSCDREFIIDGRGDQSPEEIAAQVRLHLEDTAAWTFTSGTPTRGASASWNGTCRMEGWLLDRHDSCLRVALRDDARISVYLSYMDDW